MFLDQAGYVKYLIYLIKITAAAIIIIIIIIIIMLL
jgi:hypothetical protein